MVLHFVLLDVSHELCQIRYHELNCTKMPEFCNGKMGHESDPVLHEMIVKDACKYNGQFI